MKLTKSAHDGLLKLMLVIYPSLSVAVFVMSYIWDLPYAKLILGMVALMSFAIGLYLNRSEHAYDGKIFVTASDEGVKVFTLQLDGDPAELDQKRRYPSGLRRMNQWTSVHRSSHERAVESSLDALRRTNRSNPGLERFSIWIVRSIPMNRPESIVIGPFTWSISYDDAEMERMDDDRQSKRFGVSIPRRFRIVIACSNRPESAIRETLVHEILHAIYEVSGYAASKAESQHDREEETILALSPWLFTILQQNPALVTYLSATTNEEI